MMKFILNILFFLLIGLVIHAQDEQQGNVVVFQDPLVDTLLQRYEALQLKIMENPDNKNIPGYRIQIFFDSGANSSDRARQAREEFELNFPEITAYVSWKSPNYRVRVGDYRDRLEAERYLQQILPVYPNAWVIKDEINFPKLD